MDNPEFLLLTDAPADEISDLELGMHEIAEEVVESALTELMHGFADAMEQIDRDPEYMEDPMDPYMQGRRLFRHVMMNINTGVWQHTHEYGERSEISGKREKTEPGEWTPEGFEATV